MAKRDTSVKWYSNGMTSAPTVTNQWGNLTSLLDAVLVNGFGLKVVTSLTFIPASNGSGGVVTCRIPSGHQFKVDQVVAIEGCFEDTYNGEYRIDTVETDKLTYYTPFTLPGTATTLTNITCKVAPLGFEIVFTRTNKRAYRSKNPESLGNMLVVDDGQKAAPYDNNTYAKWANVGIAEGMSDIDTVVGAQAPFDPNQQMQNWTSIQSNQMGWHKWYFGRTGRFENNGDSGGGNRLWVIVGDSRMFYLFITNAAGYNWYGRTCYCFGDIISFKPGDQYSTVLHAEDNFISIEGGTYYQQPGHAGAWGGITQTLTFQGSVFLRNHTQVGNPVRWGVTSLNVVNAQMINGDGYIPYPNAPDYSMWLMPVYCRQEDGNMRGMMPGLRWLPQATGHSDLSIIDNVVGQEGRKFLFVKSSVGASTEGCTNPFDITGPWR